MRGLSLSKGSIVYKGDKKYEVINAVNFKEVLLRDPESGETGLFPISKLRITPKSAPADNDKAEPAEHIKEEHWEIAKRKYEIIKPLLRSDRTKAEVIARGKAFGFSDVSLYDWIEKYEKTGQVSSLAPRYNERGGKDTHRIDTAVEVVITETINEYIKQGKRLKIKKIHEEVKAKCKNAKLKAPHTNTIQNRIDEMPKREIVKLNVGAAKARAVYDPIVGSFTVEHPLDVIEIDETPLDLILVDDQYREDMGKAYAVVAEDVFSRSVYGFDFSVDHPSFFTIGQCIYMGALPKQEFLKRVGVDGEWNVWGLTKNIIIYTDNASWYRGKDLKRFCEENALDVQFRPRRQPKFGGHIERFIGTLAEEVHGLPGTTFSNPQAKGEYDSQAKACMTIKEIEKWATQLIVNKYHKTPHSGIGYMMPYKKYEMGIFGDETTPGTGLPEIIQGEEARRLRISLFPSIERTIQRANVVWENIHYYSDVLRKYGEMETPGKKKTKYIFKYNPYDLSILYFYAPDLKEYFSIPYRNVSLPPISIWDLRKSQKYLKDKNMKDYNEDDIFRANAELKKIEQESVKKTKAVRRQHAGKQHHKEKMGKSTVDEGKGEALHDAVKSEPESTQKAVEARVDDIFANPKPFKDIEVIHRKSDEDERR
ncbi:MAG: Mu transposase C-terminal domain-containing protein [Dissulfurispiraceae bacterium]